MPNGAKTRTRPVSRPTEFKDILSLPSEVLAEVRRQLVDGISSYVVAGWVQNQGYCLDPEPSILAQQLRRYANKEIPLVERALYHKPGTVKRMLAKVEGMHEELNQYCDLLELQRSRIDRAVHFEENVMNGMPVHTIDKMIGEARELVTSLAQLKMDLGLAKRDLGKLSVEADVMTQIEARVSDPSQLEIIKDPVRRAKIMRAYERILRAGEPKQADVVVEVHPS